MCFTWLGVQLQDKGDCSLLEIEEVKDTGKGHKLRGREHEQDVWVRYVKVRCTFPQDVTDSKRRGGKPEVNEDE